MSLFSRLQILLSIGLLLLLQSGQALAFQSYFINKEVRSDSIQLFPKWVEMLSRYQAESRTLDAVCGQDVTSPCKLKDWKEFLIEQKGKSLADKVDAVNRYINNYPYIDDIVSWGLPDYWETPYEFQRRNGDCEDFAIAKYLSLRALSVSGDSMRITVLRDLNLGGIIHAVLSVTVDGETYVLDNQIKQVMPAVKIYHYLPIYAINERYWWQYFIPQ